MHTDVTIIRPPRLLNSRALNTNPPFPSLAIGYLCGSLKDAGILSRVIEASAEAPEQYTDFKPVGYQIHGLTPDQIAARLDPNCPIIAMTCMFSNEWILYREILDQVRAACPQALIVIGGEHVTAIPQYCLTSSPAVDICVLGEGEATFTEICRRRLANQDVRQLPGTATRDNSGQIVMNPPRPRIRDLDDIPHPDWETAHLDVYLDRGWAVDDINSRTIPMLATRGCPYSCKFCSSPGMWGTQWYTRDPDDVIAEIRTYKFKYDVEHIEFFDLTTILRRDWLLDFCAKLTAANLNVTWSMIAGTRSEALDYEAITAMKKSGCSAIAYAPESGSDSVIKRIDKRVDTTAMLKSARAAVKLNVNTRAQFIMALPDMTWREVLETYWFIAKLAWVGVNDVLLYTFCVYPGSELYEAFVAEGEIDQDAEDFDLFLLDHTTYYDHTRFRSWSSHISQTAARWSCFLGMGGFYALQFLLRPQRLFTIASNIRRGKPRTWVERMLDHQLSKRWRRPKKTADTIVQIADDAAQNAA